MNVYDATTSAASARIAQHIMVIEPSTDALQITETFLLQNDTKQTFQDATNGSIRFFLPEAARDKAEVKILAPGGMPITRPPEATKKAGVYKASYPIKPGETRFDVGYTLPPGDAFSGENLDPSAPVNLVTPPQVTLTGDFGVGAEDLGRLGDPLQHAAGKNPLPGAAGGIPGGLHAPAGLGIESPAGRAHGRGKIRRRDLPAPWQ